MKKSHIYPSLGQPGGNKEVLGISCNRGAPLLCQVGGWGGRASISQSSTGNQLNFSNTSTAKTFPAGCSALHSSCTDTTPSWTCPTPVLEFQGHIKALLGPGVQDKECLTLEAEKLLPWHLTPNRPTRRILRCSNSHIHHIEQELKHFTEQSKIHSLQTSNLLQKPSW